MRGSLGILLLLLAGPGEAARASEPSAAQAVDWLRQYVRIDSSTHEGSLEAAALLRDLLHRAGIATRWIVSPTGLPFLYARTGLGTEAAGALMLLHHVDVVPAEDSWRLPPFAAEVENELLYGRGTIDDKSLGIAHLIAFLRAARSPSPRRREVVLLAVSGEEAGGMEGLGWLLRHHAELFEDVTGVLTEGGSNRVYRRRVAWWGIEVAQKRPLWVVASASGRRGHGSSLNLHSAPHRLIRGLAGVVDRPRDYRLTPEARLFLESIARLESVAFQDTVRHLDEILSQPEPERRLLPGMPNYLLDTLQVNTLEAGSRINVVPGEARARIDIRLLPDTDEEAFLDELQLLVGEEVELEVLLDSPRVPPSPVEHPLYRCLESQLQPVAPVVPAFITAITDARFLRARNVAVYGFSPFALDASALRGIHGNDEHIPLPAFTAGVETMWQVVRRCTGD